MPLCTSIKHTVGPNNNETRQSTAIADSGANITLVNMDTPVTNIIPLTDGLEAALPDGKTIKATHQAQLDLPTLSEEAKTAYIFPNLKSGPIISLGAFCDDGCEINLTKSEIKVKKKGTTIMKGLRNTTTGMWELQLQQKEPRVNNALANATKPELVAYYHAAMFSPVKSTWLKAIKKGWLKSWPNLTEDIVKKHFEKSIHTAYGHMHQKRQGIQSTGTKYKLKEEPEMEPESKANAIFAKTVDIDEIAEETGHIYTDLCGSFPILSSKGNRYIFIMYVYDANAILAAPMKNRADAEMIRVYEELADQITTKGFGPKFHININIRYL